MLPPCPRGRTILCCFLGLALLFIPGVTRANTLEDAAHELALKVCMGPHPQVVKVQWRDASATSDNSPRATRKAFLEQVSACGMRLGDDSDASVLQVSVETTASQVLVVADWADTTNRRQTRMVEISRELLLGAKETAQGPHLESEFLWQQEKPIESAIEQQDPSSQGRFLYLLSGGRFVRMSFAEDGWKLIDSTELPAGERRPRLSESSFISTAPGKALEILLNNRKICDVDVGDRVSFTCNPGNSAGRAPQILSKCEETPRYIATGTGDYTQPDRISLRGPVTDQTAPPPSEGGSGFLEVPGPMLNMSVSEDAKTAFATVRNLSTGNYEVYRITSVCNN